MDVLGAGESPVALDMTYFDHFYFSTVCQWCLTVCVPGKHYSGATKVDSKKEDSSDIPILEETSSTPADCPQTYFLVATDIENIERSIV